jgi:general stress protein YciG
MSKEDRGFASMDRTKQREIASKGGRAAHAKGTAHEWSSAEAREAGRKGGMVSHRGRDVLTAQARSGEPQPLASSPNVTDDPAEP